MKNSAIFILLLFTGAVACRAQAPAALKPAQLEVVMRLVERAKAVAMGDGHIGHISYEVWGTTRTDGSALVYPRPYEAAHVPAGEWSGFVVDTKATEVNGQIEYQLYDIQLWARPDDAERDHPRFRIDRSGAIIRLWPREPSAEADAALEEMLKFWLAAPVIPDANPGVTR